MPSQTPGVSSCGEADRTLEIIWIVSSGIMPPVDGYIVCHSIQLPVLP